MRDRDLTILAKVRAKEAFGGGQPLPPRGTDEVLRGKWPSRKHLAFIELILEFVIVPAIAFFETIFAEYLS